MEARQYHGSGGHEKSDWPLVPKFYRSKPTNRNIEDGIREEFQTRAPILADVKPANKWEWYFLMQHYGAPTRLLDWSDGALIGLYFAVRQNHGWHDAAVWMLALRPTITNSPLCTDFPKQHWGLEFNAVEFGYERQENALLVPSLRIAPQERGSSSSGTTAPARARWPGSFHECMTYGRDRSVSVEWTFEIFGSKACAATSVIYRGIRYCLGGTVASNLLFVRPGASDCDLRTAIHLAELDDVGAALAAGLHQRIGPDA